MTDHRLVTELHVELRGAHAHIDVWVRHGKSGTLVVRLEEAADLIVRMVEPGGFGPAPAAPPTDMVVNGPEAAKERLVRQIESRCFLESIGHPPHGALASIEPPGHHDE